MGRSKVVFICRQHASLYRQVLVAQMVKNLPANARRSGFNPWVGKMPWRREWQPTPVFLPGESHGRRSLVCYSPRGRKALDMTEWLNWTEYVQTVEAV